MNTSTEIQLFQPITMLATLLLGCVLLTPSAFAYDELEPFPRSVYRFGDVDESYLLRDFILSAVEKNRRALRIEKKRKVIAARETITYELWKETSLDEIYQHYKALLKDDLLFTCVGRDCGRSNEWANAIFGIAELYGPDAKQYYLASQKGNQLHSVYIIQRGNRRIYVHVERLDLQTVDTEQATDSARGQDAAEPPVVVATKPQFDGWMSELKTQGYVRIRRSAPNAQGEVPESGLSELRTIAEHLVAESDTESAVDVSGATVLCHVMVSRQSVANAITAAERCAVQGADVASEVFEIPVVDVGMAPALPPSRAGLILLLPELIPIDG